MAQMKRRLFTLLSALSLLLCVAVVVLWVRRYWSSDTLVVRRPLTLDGNFSVHREWYVWSSGNGLGARYKWSRQDLTSIDRKDWLDFWENQQGVFLASDKPDRVPDFPAAGPTHRFGIGWTGESRVGYHELTLMAPHWLLALTASVLPAAWVWRRVHPVSRAGLCPSCGYDLRATPERCPECGEHSSPERV
jgi:hypothetical protein